jgi:hypothetical protein
MNLKRNFASLGLALALLAFAPTSSWALSVTTDGNTVTAIQDLPINGVFYNVTFPLTDANRLYGPSPDFTFQFLDPGDASFAIERVILAIETTTTPSYVATSVGMSATFQSTSFFIGYADSATQPFSIDAKNAICSNASERWLNVSGVEFLGYDEERYFADFEVVPEPGTALLMGLGLAGLSAAGRSRQGEGQGTA